MKTKLTKWLAAGALAVIASPCAAGTFAIWPNAVEGETQIPWVYNGWWNQATDEVEDNGVTVYRVMMENQTYDSASFGLLTNAASNFDFSQLADKELVFDAKVVGQGTWAIRTTGAKDEDIQLSIPADGAYHHLSFNVAEYLPANSAAWADGSCTGKDIFTFAVVGSGLAEGSTFYFNNVKYVDSYKPFVNASVTDITTTSATLNYEVNFAEGSTDQTVTINGETTADFNGSLNLTDLTARTEYTYTIVASASYNGETYTTEKVVTFMTAREAGQLPVWYGITNKDGFFAEYSITYNADKTLTVAAEIETEKETPAGDRNFHIYVGGDEWLKLKDDNGDGVLEGTTTSTFEEGSTITWEWYLPYGGGVYQEANQYVVGSENQAPAKVRIKAEATDVTSDSARITYTVTGADVYTVYYKTADGEAVAATASPIELTGLTAATEYSYELYAVATVDNAEVETPHTTVKFKTIREGAVDLVYNDIFETKFTNAFRIGETEADRRDIPASLPWSVTYRANNTAVYSIDLTGFEDIVGLVPQIWSGDFKTLTKNSGNNRWEYEFGEQVYDAEVAISHYLAYSGGGIDVRSPYTNWGMVKAAPVSLKVNATVSDVTYNSAKIEYTVTGADDYKVYYKAADGEAVEATASPIELTGLEEATSYTYEVYATANIDGEDVESEHATVTFKTTRENAVDLVYSDILNAKFENAYFIGEEETARRTVYAALPWSVTYKADGTAIYEIELTEVEDIVGLVKQIYWNGFKDLSKNAETGKYEYNFGEQEMDAEVAISHYLAFNGGKVDERSPYTKWGMEKEAPEIGAVTSLELSIIKQYVKVCEDVNVSVVAKDANGYYLNPDDLEYTITNNGEATELNVADGVLYMNIPKGDYVLTANAGDIKSNEVTIHVIALMQTDDVIAGKTGVTNTNHVNGNNHAGNATDGYTRDGNGWSYLHWNCDETEEHYLIYDFEDQYYIDAVYVQFETARASHFTVTLTNERPAELGGPVNVRNREEAAIEDDNSDVVFTFEDNNANNHVLSHNQIGKHQYMVLRTSQANNAGWGIKVEDIRAYGTTSQDVFTGIDSIEAETILDTNAEVEYYDLNGIRVAEPVNGIYVKRQGSKTTKIVVRK